MDTGLDNHVAKVVFTARLLERALHDRGPWTMTWNGIVVPADRMVESGGVTFSAVFPAACHLGEVDRFVVLRCREDEVAVREIETPGDAPFTLLWRIAGEAVAEVA